MSNPFDEIRSAVNAAKEQLRAADEAAGSLAFLLRGRLRQVSSRDSLRILKREMQDFNAVTGEWRKRS